MHYPARPTILATLVFTRFLFSGATAQTLVNTAGTTLHISSGTTLSISGNVANAGSLSNSGTLQTDGDLANSGSYTGSGTLQLSGNGDQSLDMGSSTLQSLDVNKSGGTVSLSTNTTVSSSIDLTGSGNYLKTGNVNLTLENGATISGASSSSFVVTDGTGQLVYKNLGSTAFTYPIGSSAGSGNYTPLTLSNSGTADDIGVRVMDSAYNAYTAGMPAGNALTGGNEVQKTWVVNEASAGGSNVSVTLQWNAGNEGSNFSRHYAAAGYYAAGAWQANSSFTAASGSNPFTLSRSNLSITLANTPMGVGSNLSALPLQLIDFDVIKGQNDALLSWKVANAQHLNCSEVQRSTDASTWQELTRVPASGKTLTASWIWEDKNVLNYLAAPTLYYRLKLVESGGSFTYSTAKSIDNSPVGQANFSIYPNPVSRHLTISHSQPIQYVFMNIQGKTMLKSRIVAAGNTQLDISGLAAGVYLLQLTTASGQVVQQQVVVMH